MHYGFTFEAPVGTTDPHDVPNRDWELVTYTPDGTEVLVTSMRIDSTDCTVWLCADGRYRAQDTTDTSSDPF